MMGLGGENKKWREKFLEMKEPNVQNLKPERRFWGCLVFFPFSL